MIDCGLIGIREGRVADIHPATIGTGEGGGDAQEGPKDLDGLVGDNGDEEMSIAPTFLAVLDRTQSERGVEGAKDGFNIREHGVGVPVETI